MLPLPVKRMHQIWILTFLFCLLLFSSAFAEPVIVKVSLSKNPPLVFTADNGKPSGIFIDIIEHIADEEGWTIQYVQGTWKECLGRLERGEIDILMSVAYTKERDLIFDFTSEPVFNNWGRVYAYPGSKIESIVDLEGKKVAGVRGNILTRKFVELLDSFDIESEVIEVDDYIDVFRVTQAGEVTAGLVNRVNGLKFESAYEVEKTSIIYSPIELFFATTKGRNAEIRAAIDKNMKLLKQDHGSVYYRSLDRWFGKYEPFKFPDWLKWVIGSLAGFSLLLSGMIVFSRFQVRKRTSELLSSNKELETEITERKRVENELKKHRDHLEQLVDERTGEISKTNKKLIKEMKERDEAEKALLESEAKYRTLFELSADAIMLARADGEILDVNLAMPRITGYSKKEIKELGEVKIIAPEVLEDTINDRTSQVEERGWFNVETLWVGKDGSRIPVSVLGKTMEISGDTLFEVIGRDITQRKKAEKEKQNLEEQVRQSQKMEAVGQLAGGVAHDFNNLLTAILGYSDFLVTDPGLDKVQKKYIGEIKKAAERAAALTHQLLAFSRKQMLEPKVLNINSLINDIQKMLLRLIGEDIYLTSKLDPEIGMIKADPGQIEQVVVNLGVNARDAMPNGGKLKLETKNVYIDEENAKDHADLTPGRYVMFAVSDTGHGMDKDTMKQIFDPFFTTREKGKGTGLGLSTVYGIVRQSEGQIFVDSDLKKGTVFRVYFPRVDKVEKDTEDVFGESKSLKGNETILLVEDEEMVRNLIYESLENFGYNVKKAENGNKAINYCKKNIEMPIHLLITDVIMPDMSGKELVERLDGEHLGLPVLYISGYTGDAIGKHGVLEEGVNFLQKPFTPQVLAKKVREVLDLKSV